MVSRSQDRSPGRFAYEGLARAVHEKARLSILTSLLIHRDGLSFNELKSLCSLTDGNLNRHLEVLREESFVEITKEQSAGRGSTRCRLTKEGRLRFFDYLEELQNVVRDATATTTDAPRAWKPRLQT